MLQLKNIKKDYITGNEKVEALKGITLKFRKSEFVSILGQSGCGKTTLLNIIGGLDKYTSGDLIINGKSTKKFKSRDWDSYRNYKVGFVFQSYNLITHQTILSNVELALTIGGISKKERKKRAIKALEEVGLKNQMNKKPNQLSGGQMQRVAIARALVNDPDIILADEPTGALDTKTSTQVMEILKKISKDKLIIMVTHNPDLASKYSTRIIKILDGVITSDSNPYDNQDIKQDNKKIKRTSMSLFTAFRLSLNNLLTKKGRTILVSFAGSIGIIGIALVQAVSNGFQGYVDKIQEDTLTSYPLTIMQESTDITSMLLSMTSNDKNNEKSGSLKEEQYISNMLKSLSTNDLKSFSEYLEKNKNKVNKNVSNIEYYYSVEPLIYTKDATKKIVKLNPSEAFSAAFNSSIMSSFSSVYSKMTSDKKAIKESYDILAGRLPKKYDEMMIVLSEAGTIPDLLVYSLGLRDTNELTTIVTKIMNGEKVDINNEPMTLSYDDLMNLELKLILPTDKYKYNSKYNVYEDMTTDNKNLEDLYNKAINLKIVGIVSPKPGTTSTMLTPGVSYTDDLTNYIIDNSAKSEIVKKQLDNSEVDVFSNTKFDEQNKDVDLKLDDLISIDKDKLNEAFNIKIDENTLKKQSEKYMTEINSALTVDTSEALKTIDTNLNKVANGLFDSINEKSIKETDIDTLVTNYLKDSDVSKLFTDMEKNYVIPAKTLKEAYSGILKSLLQAYVTSYTSMVPDNLKGDIVIDKSISSNIITSFMESAAITKTEQELAKVMTEAVMKKTVLTKVSELVSNITSSLSNAFNVDENKIASSFKFNMTEDEMTRIITSMLSSEKKTAKSNLINLGYQEKEEPTYISFYFDSFEGKENFIDFIDDYNKLQEKKGNEDKVINYTDATGILINSVKTIVNTVTYVLIAFTSISLIVSSFMIGIITYISVYERTKEIGILRAIGASKRNISSIFNAETFIIGLLSGLIGIGVTYSLIPIINKVLHHFIGDIPLNVLLYFKNAMILVILSVVLTLIGGLIPAKAASKKDPVIALRTE